MNCTNGFAFYNRKFNIKVIGQVVAKIFLGEIIKMFQEFVFFVSLFECIKIAIEANDIPVVLYPYQKRTFGITSFLFSQMKTGACFCNKHPFSFIRQAVPTAGRIRI
jgi:hypothetical protein